MCDLGGHPTLNMLKLTLILLSITAALVGLVVWLHPIVGALVGFFFALAWVFHIVPSVIGKLVSSLFTSRLYSDGKRLVVAGELNPSYVGRNRSCDGFAIVDEENKKLYLNGHLLTFADVKWIAHDSNTKDGHYVEIAIRSADNPVLKVFFDGKFTAETFRHRLGNTLGLA